MDPYQAAVKFSYYVNGNFREAEVILARLGEYQDDVTDS